MSFTLTVLKRLPTIRRSQTDDLKFESALMRVWLSRLTKEDGQPYDNQVTVERFNGESWKTTEQYEAQMTDVVILNFTLEQLAYAFKLPTDRIDREETIDRLSRILTGCSGKLTATEEPANFELELDKVAIRHIMSYDLHPNQLIPPLPDVEDYVQALIQKRVDTRQAQDPKRLTR